MTPVSLHAIPYAQIWLEVSGSYEYVKGVQAEQQARPRLESSQKFRFAREADVTRRVPSLSLRSDTSEGHPRSGSSLSKQIKEHPWQIPTTFKKI
jgi:hypothetical protein